MTALIFKYITGFLILCSIQYGCNVFVRYIHVPLPAPILGIIVLGLLLHFNVIKKDWIRDICNLLLKYMPLLFVPLFAGIISYYNLLEKNLIPILINITVCSALTLIITALFVENVIKFVRLDKIRKYKND